MTNQRTIYEALVNQGGLSSNQAAGVMGNMEYESSFNVEAQGMDTNGFESNGLIQWNEGSYPDAGSLVTGNSSKDLTDQINYLIHNTHNISAGLAGSTATQVGGNFAQHVEVCQGCQPGGTEYNERSAAAGRIESEAKSGNWPGGSGSGVSGGASTTASVSCPPFWASVLQGPSGIAQYFACETANGALSGITGGGNALGPIGGFIMDPVDALERAGLVIFGGLLVLIGIAILGFGPANQVLGSTAGVSRDIQAARRLSGRGSAAGAEDQKRRVALAERNVALGERKQEFREQREQRLATNRRPVRRTVSDDIRAKRAGRANAKAAASSGASN